MPYSLLPYHFGWRVCKRDEPTTCYSKNPLTKTQASKQRVAIILSEKKQKGGSRPIPSNPKLYEEVKQEIYNKYPRYSLYRSALLVKEYKNRGGEYESKKEPTSSGINKWFKEDWLSVNDYLRGDIVKCGDNHAEKWNEYPLCYAKERLKTFTKDELKKLVKKKTRLRESHLQTKELVGKGRQLYTLYPSTLKNKKWDLYYKEDDKVKKVSFGNPDYEDYTIHKDEERKKNYLKRATNIRGKWRENPFSPNNLAINVLWQTTKSPQENLDMYLRKLKIST
jgi:hypothetical protein